MKNIHRDTEFYRTGLPHLMRGSAEYFVTFRLAGSIPVALLRELAFKKQSLELKVSRMNPEDQDRRQVEDELKRQFARFDHYLDTATTGPHWLKQQEIARTLAEKIHEESANFRLDCFSIMSNHAHMVLAPYDGRQLYDILRSIKQPVAFTANKIIGRKGTFWLRGSYDHILREGEWGRAVMYVLNNPVKARLVERWEDHPWTYLPPDCLGFSTSQNTV